MRVAREGVPIIGGFVVVGAVVGGAGVWLIGPWGWAIAGLCLALVAWCVWFFRDPDRVTPSDPSAIVSPADGVVVAVAPASLPSELGMETGAGTRKISVFMNVFNVHVNRAPCAGTIEKAVYVKGSFLNASLDKASSRNERMSVAVRTPDGRRVVFSQIAGLVARRIVCRLSAGQRVSAGERFGLIRFGSRVDVYVPADVEARVTVGQRAVAGETVLASFGVVAGRPSAAREGAGVGG